MNDWFVYMVRCADDSLYTGITRDVERRMEEHNGDGGLGAKYTKARRPVVLFYQEKYESRSAATKRECEIKRFSRKEKLILAGRDGD